MPNDLSQLDPAWAWDAYIPGPNRPWGRAQAAHLYRRAGFAANAGQLAAAEKKSPSAIVAQLMTEPTDDFRKQMDGLAKSTSGNLTNLPAGWIYRLLHAPDQLTEKLVLFWHGHFTTSAAKVNDGRLMIAQNDLLRRHALGGFGPLVHEMAHDPAMLIYLDSASNHKARPNENFARELLELFCLGVGNYSERDIQQLARAFTGWEVRGGAFYFNARQHDDGGKSILGQSGALGGDQAVRIVLEQPAGPRFIVRKLIRYFICDEPAASDALVEPLARQFRDEQLDVRKLVERILTSNLFFSGHAAGRKIRSPVELAVGVLRALEASTNIYRLNSDLARLGQALYFPPSVKGWDGGRSWINSSTVLGRTNWVSSLVQPGTARFGEGGLATLLDRYGVSGPENTVAWLCELLVATEVDRPVRDQLAAAYRDTKGDPERQVARMIELLGMLPQFQLC